MPALVRSLVMAVLAVACALATPQPVAACLAYSPPADTADFEGRSPHNVLFATATYGGPPSQAAFTFTNVIAIRGRMPNRLRLGASDDWTCHPPTFRRGDRVLILEWGRLPLGLPLVWRVGPSGEILPGVIYDQRMRVVSDETFTPAVNGRVPKTLADVLSPFGIEVPDSAMVPHPEGSPVTPIGVALIVAAVGISARRIRRHGGMRIVHTAAAIVAVATMLALNPGRTLACVPETLKSWDDRFTAQAGVTGTITSRSVHLGVWEIAVERSYLGSLPSTFTLRDTGECGYPADGLRPGIRVFVLAYDKPVHGDVVGTGDTSIWTLDAPGNVTADVQSAAPPLSTLSAILEAIGLPDAAIAAPRRDPRGLGVLLLLAGAALGCLRHGVPRKRKHARPSATP